MTSSRFLVRPVKGSIFSTNLILYDKQSSILREGENQNELSDAAAKEKGRRTMSKLGHSGARLRGKTSGAPAAAETKQSCSMRTS